MGIFTASTFAKIGVELTLGICIKLFCDNGRIHYSDFVNDFLFWLPGVTSEPGDGLDRQILARIPDPVFTETVEEVLPLAAK